MPRAKPLTQYPNAEYNALWASVTPDRSITVPMSKERALTLRGQMHAWARVARANPGSARALGIQMDALDDVRLRITGEGLELFHKENSVGVEEIKGVLGKLGMPIARAAPEQVPPLGGLSADEVENIFDPDAILKRLKDVDEGGA